MAHVIEKPGFDLIELHRRLSDIIKTVATSDQHYVVRKGGIPAIVMMSYVEYEQMKRQLEAYAELTKNWKTTRSRGLKS